MLLTMISLFFMLLKEIGGCLVVSPVSTCTLIQKLCRTGCCSPSKSARTFRRLPQIPRQWEDRTPVWKSQN
ncbi:hypothetical protein M432DRAFT_607278 [Thermoascus aurantiacus ATCC 26904]